MKPSLEWAIRRAAKWFMYESASARYCKYCGMNIPANETFCPSCKRSQK